MKNRLFNAFLLLAMAGMMFTACKKEYPQPPIQDLPEGRVYTIDEILSLESGTVFTEDASVYGIITADEQSGNLYKCAFMQDRATGAAIELYLNAVSGVRIGDSIRLYLKDVTYTMYNNLPQLNGFEADGHIVILANNKPIEPAKATIAEINQGKYLAGLVRLENVRFTEQNTFAEPNTYGNRTLADPTDYSQTVIVRTSNYANFANDSLPQGTGNLVAIASVYGSTWQLYIRSAKELEFNGYIPGGDADLPYYQDFTSSFGTYTTYDVAGSQSWEIDYNTAKMTGHANSTNYANEDWLISRRFSLENVSQASMTMTYIARYFNNINEDITVWVSSDYTSGDPNEASWDQVSASWTEGSNWTDFTSTTLDLTPYVGKKVCVAVKYLSNDTKAGTIEVQSILIQEGGATPPPPGPGTGGELQYLPYTQDFTSGFGTYMTIDVLGPQSWVNQYETAKMSGYADGASHENEDWLISSPVLITAGIEHAKAVVNYAAKYQGASDNDVTMQVSTNYEFGAAPSTATWAELPVTYPNNSSGNAWTFTDQEASLDDYIGETITVAIKYTSTESASRTIEIKTITIQEGEAGGGVTPPPGPGTGEGSGTADDPYNVAAGIENECWECNSQTATDAPIAWVHGYIVGAVKNGTTSISSNSDIIWNGTFDSQTNVVIADDPSCNEISLCIIVNLPSGKPLRTQVNLVEHPENLGKTLTVYGRLRTYFGQAGLRDSGGTENDFVLEGGDTPTPPGPGTGIFSETFANGQGEFTIQDIEIAGLDYVWTYMTNYKCMKANGYYQGPHATESWLVSPQIDLSGVSAATLKFEHAVAFADAQGYLSVLVSTDYAGDVATARWTELNIGTWPEPNSSWVFEGTSADLSAFVGQNVTIAFKYTSTEDHCPAWEMKNFVIE